MPRVYEGDARRLPLATNTVDLVLTSPPYLNAIDYIRCSKFSLVWMGYSVGNLRELRGKSIGAEVGASSVLGAHSLLKGLNLERRNKAILANYVNDIEEAISEVARVLVPGGKAVYVIGENTVRSTFIPTSRIVSLIARRAGLKKIKCQARHLPTSRRYLPPPSPGSAALDNRLRREVVITFRKPA